jgi:hypothetical protein
MKQTLKKITPRPIWRFFSNNYWWWRNRGRHLWAKRLSFSWRANQSRLESFRDMYKGKRCFIMGNGPSLRKMDLSPLRNEITFGLNRIYLLFPELGFTTTFLVQINDLVIEQCAAEVSALSIPKFITWRSRKYFRPRKDLMFIDTDFTGEENFSPDITGRFYEAYTVTNAALQIAFFMGFEEVILIGVDHNYQTKGPANTTVVSEGEDPNHFIGNYFGKGFRWQLPDLEGSEQGYERARQAYAAAGRRVLDATVEGKLTIFPRVDFKDLFGGK